MKSDCQNYEKTQQTSSEKIKEYLHKIDQSLIRNWLSALVSSFKSPHISRLKLGSSCRSRHRALSHSLKPLANDAVPQSSYIWWVWASLLRRKCDWQERERERVLGSHNSISLFSFSLLSSRRADTHHLPDNNVWVFLSFFTLTWWTANLYSCGLFIQIWPWACFTQKQSVGFVIWLCLQCSK